MPRVAAIFFPLFALLTVAAVRADDTPTLDTAPTKKENISIRLPAGWVPDENPPPHAILLARVPQRDKDETSDFQALLAISSIAGNIVDPGAQQDRIAREIPSYKVVEKPTRIHIGKLEAVTFGGTFSQGPLKLRARQYMLTKDNQIYILTFTSLESHWLDYVGLLEASAGTLIIGDKNKN